MSGTTRPCPACRTPLPDEAHFCLNCGAATPTEPGVPPRTGATDVGEVARVRRALAGTYRIERVLGEGGMATVYLAEDLKHRRNVAIKVMRPDLASTLGAERFLREVEIAAQLSHPHILPVYDSGNAEGVLYYVMPYVEGESLAERIRRQSQLPVDDALRIAREVCEALAYAHGQQIVHRDIKPANILLSGGHALVADFGIARAIGSDGPAITKTGLAIGTPHYMSPEQASGLPTVDARTDVYAAGCVLYEMIAGEPPFTGPNPQAIVARSLTETPRALTATREGLPPALDTVVRRSLAKSPADRWQTAEAFSTALGQALDAMREPTHFASATASSGPSPVTVWGLFLGISAAALLMIFGLVHRFGLPSWVLGLAVGLVLVGTGVFIATGKIEARRRAGAAPTGLAGLLSWRSAATGGVAALGLWITVASVLILRGTHSGAAAGVARLAVLPFENRGAADDAYLVEGIADQVHSKLANLNGFLVTARTSSDLYRDSRKLPQDIGRELGVDYLLAATVRLTKDESGNDRAYVNPELIEVRTGASRWHENYEGAIADLFQIQGSIVRQVASALGVDIGTTTQLELAERPTSNLAAWDAYLRGERARVARLDADALREYSRAVALDSTFALAWAKVSTAASSIYYSSPSRELAIRARTAAARAMALAPKLPFTHLAIGTVASNVDGDHAEALRAYEAGLALAPNDPLLLRQTGNVKLTLGQFDEAIALFRKVRELDPRSARPHAALGAALLAQRSVAAADSAHEAAAALNPTNLAVLVGRVMVRLQRGDLTAARAVIAATPSEIGPTRVVSFVGQTWDLFWTLSDQQQALLLRLTPSDFDDDRSGWALTLAGVSWIRGDTDRARSYGDSARIEFDARLETLPDDNYLLVLRGIAQAYAGRRAEAIRDGERAVELLPITKDALSGAYNLHVLARIYTVVGEQDKAVETLRQILAHPYFINREWLRIDPNFAPLRSHPGFQALLAGS